ncbi:MAG: DUF1684 domain-containing protein [Thermoflexales bacterium]|nr:DUF1684 domain-containing protein [Thermoflexales bacterium]
MSNYDQEMRAFRESLDASLRAEDGWLTLVGLFWLEEGANTVGGDPACDIALPPERVPARLGVIDFHDGQAVLRAEPGVDVRVDGQPVTQATLRDDHSGAPSLVTAGSVTFFVIRRGDRFGIRARDAQHPARASFTGRKWLPYNPVYRVVGTFSPHLPSRMLSNVNVVGIAERMENPGTVTFSLFGRSMTMEAFSAGERALWFVLRDATAGKTTYGAGRFLKVPLAADGSVDMDFNRAYNPPCAFTPYATCPLPPPENILPVELPVGERV